MPLLQYQCSSAAQLLGMASLWASVCTCVFLRSAGLSDQPGQSLLSRMACQSAASLAMELWKPIPVFSQSFDKCRRTCRVVSHLCRYPANRIHFSLWPYDHPLKTCGRLPWFGLSILVSLIYHCLPYACLKTRYSTLLFCWKETSVSVSFQTIVFMLELLKPRKHQGDRERVLGCCLGYVNFTSYFRCQKSVSWDVCIISVADHRKATQDIALGGVFHQRKRFCKLEERFYRKE